MSDDTTVRQFVYLAGTALEEWNRGRREPAMELAVRAAELLADAENVVRMGRSRLVRMRVPGELIGFYRIAASIAFMTGMHKSGRAMLQFARLVEHRTLRWGWSDRWRTGRSIRPGWDDNGGLVCGN